MRTWFWTLVVFLGAVLLALVLKDHGGNVLIMVPPWRIELSVMLAILLIVGGFIALHALLRLMSWLGAGPGRVSSWRRSRREQRHHERLEQGWIAILEGRYAEAEKVLHRLVSDDVGGESRKVLAALASARASHFLGNFDLRDQVLAQAREHARGELRLQEAVAVVMADMYLDQAKAQEAIDLLQPVQDASSRHFQATQLLLRAHVQLNQHDRVYDLVRLLGRRNVMDKAQLRQLLESAVAHRLQAGGLGEFKAIWADLKAEERLYPEIALVAANLHESAGQHEEAGRILEAALNAQLDPRLLSAYSRCPADQVARRLNKAEVWLKANPDDSALLAALGNLCLSGELWGQAERYLLRSMRLRSDVRIHALLGTLYDRLGRQNDAMTHWRLASGVTGMLPELPLHRLLPAADTRGDPMLIDVADLQEPAPIDPLAPLGASAADHLGTVADEGRPSVVVQPAAPPDASSLVSGAPVSSSQDDAVQDYFDSAPIPGVDVSQTSDRPRSRVDS